MIGIDFRFKDLIIDDIKLKLKIWDTAGQEKYRAITSNSYKGAAGAILVFDLTDEATLASIQGWVRQIKNHAGENIPKILLGNKCDLEGKVKMEEISSVCKECGMTYFETSAKINRNIVESFMFIAKEIVNAAKTENTLQNQNGNGNGNHIESKQEYENVPKMAGVKLGKKYDNNDISDFSQCKC